MLTKLKAFKTKLDTIKYRQQELSLEISGNNQKMLKYKNNIDTINESIQYYKKAADILQYQRLEELIKFVNDALEHVYTDEKYQFRIELSDKYTKSLMLQLYDAKKDLLKPLRKGNGKGVKAVICYVLYVYFCCELGADVLWQDETLANISPKYVEKLFNYVRTLCEARQINQVMITQDPRFIKHGHIIYTMDHGKLSMEINAE